MTCTVNNSAYIFASKPFENEGINLLPDDEPSVSSAQVPMKEGYGNAPWKKKTAPENGLLSSLLTFLCRVLSSRSRAVLHTLEAH